MSVHLLGNELSRWDEVKGGSLLITFFADERPLRGAAGLADWRLCGRLSRLVKRGKLSGARGETLLLPPGRRLPFTSILMFGLGSSRGFDEATFRAHVRWLREVASKAGVSDYAVQPPGRATGLIGARRALELWLEEADKDGYAGEVAIIDNQSGQKDMAEILRYQKKRRAG
ncbi:M17 family peptidase N-terminal domain-containing protein [Haliangium sp.]|uniref:M17 family peptidase N-terminal domain-containing protein n=1 Tax=Haliangium sp. TaxID=2663208 RepID=UPI003D1375C8